MGGVTGGHGTPRILVVDDELDIATVIATALRYGGYEALLATSGEEALRLWSAEEPDLVLLDLNLPGIGGFEVAGTMRAGASPAPVLFLTARDLPDDEDRAAELGARGLIRKPFSLEALLRRIAAIAPPRRSTTSSADSDWT